MRKLAFSPPQSMAMVAVCTGGGPNVGLWTHPEGPPRLLAAGLLWRPGDCWRGLLGTPVVSAGRLAPTESSGPPIQKVTL